jgi:hypothetical protein
MERLMFADPLSPEDEYWVGYFRADGHLRKIKHNRCASFMQTRFHPVNELACHIGKKGKVISRGLRTNKGFYIGHHLFSAELGYAMDRLGVKDQLRPDLYLSKHFWRGMIDGDGCIFHHRTKLASGKESWSPGVSLLASLQDNQHYREFIKTPLDGFEVHLQPTKSGDMCYANVVGNRAKLIAHLLYENEYTANIKKYAKVRAILDKPWSTAPNSWRPHKPC